MRRRTSGFRHVEGVEQVNDRVCEVNVLDQAFRVFDVARHPWLAPTAASTSATELEGLGGGRLSRVLPGWLNRARQLVDVVHEAGYVHLEGRGIQGQGGRHDEGCQG